MRGMGSTGIFITGLGGLIERVTADSNAGGGLLIAGSVIESTATRNGTFGIFAIVVRDSLATDNHEVGIQLDSSGGVATGNIASFNGTNGISAPNGTVTSNTTVRNNSFGIYGRLSEQHHRQHRRFQLARKHNDNERNGLRAGQQRDSPVTT